MVDISTLVPNCCEVRTRQKLFVWARTLARQAKSTANYVDNALVEEAACEPAPSEVGKKIRRASRSVVTPRTSSSPDRSRLVSLALDYTRLSSPKPNREPVRRL